MDQFLSLLDIAKRNGTDTAVGLVEEVINYCPELEKIMGRSIRGTWTTARVRTGYTKGGAFRKSNAGVAIGSSTYEKKRFNAFFFDSPLQIDEADARAAEQENDSLASLQADEGTGAIRAKAIDLGTQLYLGSNWDPLGPPGLMDFLNVQASVTDPVTGAAVNQTVDALGASAVGTSTCLWAIWMHQQGVHWLWGADQAIDLKPWFLQRVTDANGNHFMAWITNLSGFIGTECAHVRAVGCVKNLIPGFDGAGATPLTDAMIARLEAKFPVGIKPNMFLGNRGAVASLQLSRAVTLLGNPAGPSSAWSGGATTLAPWPTMTTSGIPIITTDSVPYTNSF